MRKIIIGTRGSDLALWQAHYTKKALEEKGQVVEIKIISTQGDRSQAWNTSFDKMEGKGFFTKELEEELISGNIDLAVHSHKDLPTENPPGLIIAAVSEREDPSDLLLIRKESVDSRKKFQLKQGALVGTSSARRKSQFLSWRDDVSLKDLRGNVPTRIQKLRDGQYDAILLAAAGIERLALNLSEFHAEKLNPREFVPAPAQGVLAWQIRENDEELASILSEINQEDVALTISIERKILNLFDGGCQLPLGAYCETDTDDEGRRCFKTWVTLADAWDQQARPFYFKTYFTDDFARQIVEKINAVQQRKVFITRNLRQEDYFFKWLKKLGFTPQGQSLIEFKQIDIKEVPATDWIFFSSKHAVKYFFRQKPPLGKVKFACISKATAQELRAFGYTSDFIGQNTDTKLIGKQFSSLAGKARVLFPIAKESMQSIQHQLVNKENAVNLPVYQTIKHSQPISAENDILVFTSPSNVEAYFELNTIARHQQVVAMGEATGKALERKGIRKYVMPASFDDLGLVQNVLSLS